MNHPFSAGSGRFVIPRMASLDGPAPIQRPLAHCIDCQGKGYIICDQWGRRKHCFCFWYNQAEDPEDAPVVSAPIPL